MLTPEQLTQMAKFTVKMDKNDKNPKTYSVRVVYKNDAEVLAEALKATKVTIQRRIRAGEIEIPISRVVTVDVKGDPELTPEEKQQALLNGLDETKARALFEMLAKRFGTTTPTTDAQPKVLEISPTESEPEEEEEEIDIDARIDALKEMNLKALRALCDEHEIDHEDLTREEMAEAIAMAE